MATPAFLRGGSGTPRTSLHGVARCDGQRDAWVSLVLAEATPSERLQQAKARGLPYSQRRLWTFFYARLAAGGTLVAMTCLQTQRRVRRTPRSGSSCTMRATLKLHSIHLPCLSTSCVSISHVSGSIGNTGRPIPRMSVDGGRPEASGAWSNRCV
jgi:hypothetical protein